MVNFGLFSMAWVRRPSLIKCIWAIMPKRLTRDPTMWRRPSRARLVDSARFLQRKGKGTHIHQVTTRCGCSVWLYQFTHNSVPCLCGGKIGGWTNRLISLESLNLSSTGCYTSRPGLIKEEEGIWDISGIWKVILANHERSQGLDRKEKAKVRILGIGIPPFIALCFTGLHRCSPPPAFFFFFFFF